MDIRAMIVDDSGIMRKMVIRGLTQTKLANFAFIEAKDGADALEKFDPEQIDMLFVDWNMPNMSGIEFIRAVRTKEKEHTPVVMITTENTMGKIEEALDEAKVDCFVVKPFTPDILTKKLEPLFDKLSEESKKGGFFGKLASKMN